MPHLAPISWRAFEKLLLHVGCRFKRQKGDHRIYKRSDLKRPIVVPRQNDLPSFVILNALKELKITRDEYQEMVHWL